MSEEPKYHSTFVPMRIPRLKGTLKKGKVLKVWKAVGDGILNVHLEKHKLQVGKKPVLAGEFLYYTLVGLRKL